MHPHKKVLQRTPFFMACQDSDRWIGIDNLCVLQGGDPTGTGRGGRSIYGDKFEDEIVRHHHSDKMY
jgi:hypothetical protein